MAQDPLKPLDDGRIRLPPVDGGMNKIAPVDRVGGKGTKDEPLRAGGQTKDRDAEKDAKLLAKARKRFDRAIQAEADNRKAALEDRNFLAGDQWPADVAAQRNFDKRPCLTINKLPTFVHQVTNDQRMNRPGINISPVGDKGDPEVAKMFAGLVRHIERESNADIAYDTGFADSVGSGFGYWRVGTEFESPNTFNQTIVIKRIRNPFTVYLDPDHQEPDGSDSRYGFVTEELPRSEFEELYPDADPMPWTAAGVGESMKSWISQDKVRIAEYYTIETKRRTLVALSNGHVGWKDELSEEAQQFEVMREREADCPAVKCYKITAKDVLEETDWPGKWVPIVKCIGDEIDIQGKVKLSGLVRNAKDAQRMYNYWKTSETELIALAPKAPWIVEEGQIEGHETEWNQANVKSYPFLQYKGVSIGSTPAPPPQRQQFAQIPVGVVNAAQGAAQDMMATTGIRFDATLGERTYDESGRALRELRRSGDIGSFHYVDNLARSLRHTGEIIVDLIPKVYDTRRVLTILREDGSEERVTIDPNAPKPTQELQDVNDPAGKVRKIFNPTIGRYGVTVTIGPSYATKRVEAAESMMDFARALPNTAMLIADLIAKNQDWPGAEQMAARLAKAVPPNLLTPEQKDMSPQVQAMLSALDQQVKQLSQERQELIKALTDQQADRAQKQDKIDKDFEAKLLGIVQRMEAAYNTHVGSQLKDLAEGVRLLRDTIASPVETDDEGGADG